MASSNVYEESYNKYKSQYKALKSSHTEIYLIRHGQTEWNLLGRGQGQEADIPINDTGKEDARKTGEYLKQFRAKDKPFDAIYASPMLRAKETAEIIANIINYDQPIIYMDNLKERKHGKLSGLTKSDPLYKILSEYRQKYVSLDPVENVSQDIVYEHLNQDHDIGFELDRDLENRAYDCMKQILTSDHKKILIISHGGLLLSLIRKIFSIPRAPESDFSAGENCWISLMSYNKGFKMIFPPNTAHLKLSL